MEKNPFRLAVRRPLLSTRARRWAVGLPLRSERPPSVFVHIPKSAGMSVISGLKIEKLNTIHGAVQFFYPGHPVTFGHMSLLELKRSSLLTSDHFDEAFVFTFVRNPSTCAVSPFRYLLQTRSRLLDGVVAPGFIEEAATGRLNGEAVFEEFVRFLQHVADGVPRIGAYNRFGLSQANPQVRWTEGVRIDFVGSFEHFERDFRLVASRVIGEDCQPIHDNASRLLGHVSHRELLRAESRELIERIYQEDFEAFGYRQERGE